MNLVFFFILFYITHLIFKKYSNKKKFIQLRLFFSFNLILLMPISYANPLVAFMLGYFYGKKIINVDGLIFSLQNRGGISSMFYKY